MKQDLWEQEWTITEVVEQLLGWGNGSGEEFMEWLTESQLTQEKAQEIFEYLDLATRMSNELEQEADEYRRAKGLIE